MEVVVVVEVGVVVVVEFIRFIRTNDDKPHHFISSILLSKILLLSCYIMSDYVFFN